MGGWALEALAALAVIPLLVIGGLLLASVIYGIWFICALLWEIIRTGK